MVRSKLIPTVQLMHAGEEIFYLLLPATVIYLILERRKRRQGEGDPEPKDDEAPGQDLP